MYSILPSAFSSRFEAVHIVRSVFENFLDGFVLNFRVLFILLHKVAVFFVLIGFVILIVCTTSIVSKLVIDSRTF